MKNSDSLNIIGLMSGTSLDGVDLALCKFKKVFDSWSFELVKSDTIVYPNKFKNELLIATQLSGEDLNVLDIKLGNWFGECINKFKKGERVDFISSHGHTIFHQPQNGFTLQIGNGVAIHAMTGLPVINDFRSLDVAYNGQGAPLVPIGDQLLFSDMTFCLNLGGIANISFDDEKGLRRAFDIVPCNMLLNKIANKQGLEYDKDGFIASKGEIIQNLLMKWKNFNYYQQNYPKSLGYEWVSDNYFEDVLSGNHSDEDLMRTTIQHIVNEIKDAVSLSTNRTDLKRKILISGGGAKNSFLINQLKKVIPNEIDFVVPEEKIIDFKEAIIFAFLGALRINGQINCLSSVTGASKNCSSGTMIGF